MISKEDYETTKNQLQDLAYLDKYVNVNEDHFIQALFPLNEVTSNTRVTFTGYAKRILELLEYIKNTCTPEGVEWPKFEDGTPVNIEDRVRIQYYGNMDDFEGEVKEINFSSQGVELKNTEGYRVLYFEDQPVERINPLDKDGVEIKIGDTVYNVDSSRIIDSEYVDRCAGPGKVIKFNKKNHNNVIVEFSNGRTGDLLSTSLTHNKVDTLKDIILDFEKETQEYWKCKYVNCKECPAKIEELPPNEYYNVTNCNEAKWVDLQQRLKNIQEYAQSKYNSPIIGPE